MSKYILYQILKHTTCKLLLTIYEDGRRLYHHLTRGGINDGGERAVGWGHLGLLLLLRLKLESFSLSSQILAPLVGR